MKMFLFIMSMLAISMTIIITHNVLIWSTLLTLSTMIMINLLSKYNIRSMTLYILGQEMFNLLFLYLMVKNETLCCTMILFIKLGVAPLMFWFPATFNMSSWFNFMWALTLQKLPMLIILMKIMNNYSMMPLMLGLMMCFILMLLTNSLTTLTFLSSSSMMNISIFLWMEWALDSMCFTLLYILTTYMGMYPTQNNKNGNIPMGLLFYFMSMPFTMIFFMKTMFVCNMSHSSPILSLMILLLASLSSLAYLKLYFMYFMHFKWKTTNILVGIFICLTMILMF